MGLFDKLFGGTNSKGMDAQAERNTQTAQQLGQLAEAARQDSLSLFPAAQQASASGFQSALDMFGQAIPQQMSVFQQGNMGAQQAHLVGLSNLQRALMGQPVDLSMESLQKHLQPIQYDSSFANQRLPAFHYSDELGLAGQPTLPSGQNMRNTPPPDAKSTIADFARGVMADQSMPGLVKVDTILNKAKQLGINNPEEMARYSGLPLEMINRNLNIAGQTFAQPPPPTQYSAPRPQSAPPQTSQSTIGNYASQVMANEALGGIQKVDAILNQAKAMGITSPEELSKRSGLPLDMIKRNLAAAGRSF